MSIDDEIFADLCCSWKETLIVKLLDKEVCFITMKVKLANTWKLVGDFEFLNVYNGFYLAVLTWSTNFNSFIAKIEKTLSWVRFPRMNFIYYGESILLVMASKVDNLLRLIKER